MSTAVSDGDLPDLYRRQAVRLRQEADLAETLEMRVMLLETAKRLSRWPQSIKTGRRIKLTTSASKYNRLGCSTASIDQVGRQYTPSIIL